MNTIKTIVTLAILGGGLTGRGQSTFQDLDFEAATPGTPVYGPIGPYYQPVNLALPGWTVYMGTTQQTQVTQNAYSLGEGAVDIFGPKYQSAGAQSTFQPGIINGNYTVFLQAGTPTGLGDAIIEQNGTIAAKEQTLIWKQWDWLTPAQNPTASVLTVSFSGNVLTPVVLGSGANYTLYGANIAPYAGQTGELEFDASDTGLSWIELDDISFSNTSVVPEPSTLALTGFGGLIFALHRRFQKQMTARILFLITAALFITGASIHAQQAFQNLNFESANPVIVQNSPYYPNVVTAASALPDWTVTIGGVAQSQVFYNDPSTGSTWVMLAGPGTDYFGVKPIDGSYSVLLQGGGTASAAAISQTELIPAGTQYLMFDASQPANGSGPLDVLINNESLPFTVVGTGPNYTLYIANISAWAGLTEQLTFSVPESAQPNNWEIDDISFSPTPEPDPLILTGIAGLIFALHRRFQKQ